jgi:hypothetical protein
MAGSTGFISDDPRTCRGGFCRIERMAKHNGWLGSIGGV